MDMELAESDIKDAIRIGSKRSDDRKRLLKVTLHQLAVKREILGKAKLLKSSKYGHIYINPDLTPDQRKRDSELRKVLKDRRANGESNLVIRRGEIILNNVQRTQKKIENEDDISMADLESEKDSDSESETDAEHESDDTNSLVSDVSLQDITIEPHKEHEKITENQENVEPVNENSSKLDNPESSNNSNDNMIENEGPKEREVSKDLNTQEALSAGVTTRQKSNTKNSTST